MDRYGITADEQSIRKSIGGIAAAKHGDLLSVKGFGDLQCHILCDRTGIS